jgi:hypothetical protein
VLQSGEFEFRPDGRQRDRDFELAEVVDAGKFSTTDAHD